MEIPSLPERYEVLSAIGEGATGTVHRARDHLLSMEVAVKVVRPNLAVHRRFRARFAREVAIAAQVAHPCLVPIHDTGRTTDGRPFVAMSMARAGNLAHKLAEGVPLAQLAVWLDQVLEALAVLHARGFVHQDLKPPNVLLDPDDASDALRSWVSDLGETHAMTVLAHDPRGVGGTPAYMAPEQLAQQPQEMGPWTDLYAVGLMLWEAVCGAPPHAGMDRRELLARRLEAPPTPAHPDGRPLPAPLEDLLEILLDPDPRQRYDRAADVRIALKAALDEVETGIRLQPGVTRRPGAAGPVLPTGEAVFGNARGSRFSGARAIRWNRVRIQALPIEPPPAQGHRSTARASLAMLALRDLPLIGRDAIRRVMWDIARRVVEQQEPGVVVLVGDSGTGKTRLVESVARSLDELGAMEVVRLRYHWPPGPDDGYRGAVLELLSPWGDTREALQKRLVRWLSRDRRLPPEEVASEATVLARWCGHRHPEEPPVNAAVGLAWLYRHLDARSWRGGGCLVLDDVHRSAVEGDGLAIAQALLDRSVGDRPVLVLATVAAESLRENAALRARLQQLEDRGAMVLQVPPLTLQETRQVLDSALLLDPALAREVARVCSGNPLAVSLLLREWAARDLLVLRRDGVFALRPGVPMEGAVPGNIEQLYVNRLHAAVQASEDPPAMAEALALAAVAGQEPPATVLREASETGLDSLLSAGVLREEGTVLTFEHGAMQQTALRLALRLPEAPELHLRLGEVWRALGERSGMSVDFPLGVHLLRGGDPQGATGPLVRAIRGFIEEGRNALAAWASGLGREAADRAGAAMPRQEMRRLHAEALVELRRYGEAEQLVREALTLEPVDRLTWGRLHLLLSRAAVGRGDLDSCRRWLDLASQAFEALQDHEGIRDVLHGRASLERLEGRPAEAIRLFHAALKHLRRDPRREVIILSGLIEAMLAAGDPRVDSWRMRMMNTARESGDTRNIAQATYTSAMFYLYRRQLREAERYLQTATALSATLGADWLHLNCENNLGEVARFRGDLAQARFHYDRYSRFAQELGLPNAAAVGQINLALLALQVRQYGDLERHVAAAEEILGRQPRQWTWVFVGLLKAVLAARERDEPRTRAWWSVAREHGLAGLRTPDLWLPLQRLVEASASCGWADLARSAWEHARALSTSSRADVEDVAGGAADADSLETLIEDPADGSGPPTD